MGNSKKLIVIAGPTAVGKTAVAIKVAQHFHTEIISADSRQCFKEMKIGVARPSQQELESVKHHFIASHSVQEEVTAASFEQFALQVCNKLYQEHETVVMTGGTGLYIKAFCEGLDSIPGIEPSIRQNIIDNYHQKGLQWLQDQLREKDPAFFSIGEVQNPQRMMRALEVVEGTGKSVLDFRKNEKANRDFEIIKIGLELPRDQLIFNINNRVDKMLSAGLVDEVKSLGKFRHLNALQTVGYSEIFEFLDEKISLSEAVERIKINTRQYAKRQMTWFKKDKDFTWFAPEQVDQVIMMLDLKIREQ